MRQPMYHVVFNGKFWDTLPDYKVKEMKNPEIIFSSDSEHECFRHSDHLNISDRRVKHSNDTWSKMSSYYI